MADVIYLDFSEIFDTILMSTLKKRGLGKHTVRLTEKQLNHWAQSVGISGSGSS